MGEQIKKTEVPVRSKRLAKIGSAKTPRMGVVAPETIKVPDVDALLDKMKRATAPPIDSSREYGRCSVNCKCPPCQRGQCGSCYVEAKRHSREDVRPLLAEYRGVVIG